MSVHISKIVRRTLLSVGVLLLLFVGAGVAYTFVMDQRGIKSGSTMTAQVATQSEPVIKATQPAPNAKEGASVETLTTPVSQGMNASITVKTNPGSACTILVVYNNVPSTDSGLSRKLADDYGTVSWTWTVGQGVPIGLWPVTATCMYHTQSAVVQGQLQVTK